MAAATHETCISSGLQHWFFTLNIFMLFFVRVRKTWKNLLGCPCEFVKETRQWRGGGGSEFFRIILMILSFKP